MSVERREVRLHVSVQSISDKFFGLLEVELLMPMLKKKFNCFVHLFSSFNCILLSVILSTPSFIVM